MFEIYKLNYLKISHFFNLKKMIGPTEIIKLICNYSVLVLTQYLKEFPRKGWFSNVCTTDFAKPSTKITIEAAPSCESTSGHG